STCGPVIYPVARGAAVLRLRRGRARRPTDASAPTGVVRRETGAGLGAGARVRVTLLLPPVAGAGRVVPGRLDRLHRRHRPGRPHRRPVPRVGGEPRTLGSPGAGVLPGAGGGRVRGPLGPPPGDGGL